MSEIRDELKYLSSHEWCRLEEDGSVTVGITDYAQDSLGDIVFVECPDVDSAISAGDEAGVIESVKAASDIYSPVSGQVIAINQALEDAPEQVNESPYDDGWLYKVKPADLSELDNALNSKDYKKLLEEESE